MNAIALANGSEDQGGADLDAWARAGELTLPATLAWGDRDLGFVAARAAELVRRLPNARGRVLPGTAHLPHLEDPDAVARPVLEAVAGR